MCGPPSGGVWRSSIRCPRPKRNQSITLVLHPGRPEVLRKFRRIIEVNKHIPLDPADLPLPDSLHAAQQAKGQPREREGNP